jgi:cell division protein FtsB
MNSSVNRSAPRRGRGPISDAFSNALCACVISYCIVSLIAGQAGVLAYRDLSAGITRMEERIGALKEENKTLSDARMAINSDSDRIAREARDIGFIRPGEKIVTLFTSAAPAAPLRGADLEELRASDSTGLPDDLIKLMSAMTGASVLLASLLMSISRGKRLTIRTSASRS